MSSKCTITFDNNPLGVYYAGQVVSGVAELTTKRTKIIRSIYISICGHAETRWTENVTKQDTEGKPQKTIETFSGSELYYSTENHVYGQSGGIQFDLPAGKYTFAFQTTIPPNAPTSFNGSWGQVQHEVALVIDRVMRYDNKFKQGYTVISPYDLNLNPDHMKQLHKIDEKTFCWGLCCGGKGPMVMHVTVPYSAYAPGQKIRFHVVLDNQSDVHCSDVKVRLMKKVTFTSRNPEAKRQVVEVKVADNHCGEVVKHNKAEFNEYLQIPSTTPTSLENCSLIKVSYMLKFIAKISRIHGDLVIEFPLAIGTVPLYASANDQGPVTTQPGAGPTYKPLPPPMFEEDIRCESFEDNTFRPRYPVFLSDTGLTPIGNGPNNQPLPPSNSVYPSLVVPTPAPGPATPQHKNSPAAQNYPPFPAAASSSSTPSGPALHNAAASAKPGSSTGGGNVEALGFSLPPDYEPTPAPAPGSKPGIGWK
ncbi:arrestin domain-containing protein 1 [Anastrepha ludens]|uniref:arrestin domain-containing protein 1 n=1 Tax=Anastrepha ludens TaxID=28586 RepID=UPI0023AFD365|nr:arrestin domain-containing protein 1 [Anastrepha ludens]XP_053969000.1 arrestin domain-containing protein 1 [Anastrepha ludens]